MELTLVRHAQAHEQLAKLAQLARENHGSRQQVRVVSPRLVDEGVHTHETFIGQRRPAVHHL
ncbi:hypothetical protein SK571_07115 [Lentzea sp. BCCO 10_0798]|uniref:Uncharacterized protein n=1 Tax=Lentzea kristufekii TaxID=3095430 RepID=A0ABU4TLN0_9PSEU|nr:hypothetical protein [Lentzea sp. BCCO 10_0798]MDX8049144.1 hypothetical protein [Lentzea sp. BCCO 10_0798]